MDESKSLNIEYFLFHQENDALIFIKKFFSILTPAFLKMQEYGKEKSLMHFCRQEKRGTGNGIITSAAYFKKN